MSGLRKLSIRCSIKENNGLEDFFEALQGSLTQNTTITTLTLEGFGSAHETAQRYLPHIRRYLAINLVGHFSLFTVNVALGLWAAVLARPSNEADGIYYVLTAMPAILRSRRMT